MSIPTAANAETAIVQLLMNDTGVSGIVSSRVWLNSAPQQKDADILPYIVGHVVDKQHAHHLRGASGIAWTRLQLNLFASSYREAKELADAARIALDGFRGAVSVGTNTVEIKHLMMDMEQDNFNPPIDGSQKGRHQVIQDWKIANEESVPVFPGV